MTTIVPNPSNVPGDPTNTRRRRGRPRLADRQLTDSIEEPLARRRLYTRLSQRAWRDRQRQKLVSQEAIINDIRAAVLRLERLAVQNKVMEKMPGFATEVFRCVALVRRVGTGIGNGSGSGSGSADASGSERDSRTGAGRGTETSSIVSMTPDQPLRSAMDTRANTGRASFDGVVVETGRGTRGNVNMLGEAIDDRIRESQEGLSVEELRQNIADDDSFQSLLSHGHGHRLILTPSSSAAAAGAALPPPSSEAHDAAREPSSTEPTGSVVLQSSYPNLSSFPASGPMRTITPLWTYSIHETSFSRRLHRSCIEHCYRLLSSHSTRRAELLRTLKLPLAAHLTIDELRRRARELLLRGTDQSLNYRAALDEGDSMPQVIRGVVSSTRRPLKSLLPRPDSTSRTSNLMLASADETHSATVSEIHVSGYEGAWLGPDSVAMYLQSLGIPIQDRPSSMTVPWVVSSNVLEDMLRGSDRTPYLPLSMSTRHTHEQFYTPHMVVVNMDLDLMVDTLTQRSVCVDTPVFRKEDVDNIVVDALISWYRSAYGGEDGVD